MFQNQQYAHIVSYCENDECRAEFSNVRLLRDLWYRVHQPVQRPLQHNQERHLHKFTEKRSEFAAAIGAAFAVIGIFVVTNVVAGIFAVIVAAAVGIGISSTVCVCLCVRKRTHQEGKDGRKHWLQQQPTVQGQRH